MSRFPRPALLFGSLIGAFIAAAPAAAQTTVLACLTGGQGMLITTDLAARTLTADFLQEDGSVLKSPYQRLAAEITEEQIASTSRRGADWVKFTVNRYSLVMTMASYHGAGVGQKTYQCQRYQRGPRQF
jgi:hypothetical protein